jgi:3-oxoisoapionate decarboxylase
MIHRRNVLRLCAGGVAAAWMGRVAAGGAAEPKPRTGLGIVLYSCGLRQRARKNRNAGDDLFEPLAFLEHCRQLGAGGIQLPLGVREEEYTRRLRRQAEQYGMFVEGMAGAPGDRGGVERFEAELRTAARAGVRDVRLVLFPGRRYETFASADEFRQATERARLALERAAPAAERQRVRLAVENHKDQRAAERVALLARISSEWVGACVDVGNNLALLEDPLQFVETLAPWAFSVHLKDQAVREYEDGFLFADVPLGQGFIDLKAIAAVLRKAKPDARFSLELITRDPLKVPCLTEKYWATLEGVPGSELARTLRTVRKHQAAELPQVSSLSPEEQLLREQQNLQASLAYAREQLGM